jgi:hypothetical protein
LSLFERSKIFFLLRYENKTLLIRKWNFFLSLYCLYKIEAFKSICENMKSLMKNSCER